MAMDEGARKDPRLPEVPLKWTDFMWSLEKLRHKPYSKNTTERYSREKDIDNVVMAVLTVLGIGFVLTHWRWYFWAAKHFVLDSQPTEM